jgi:eukaryotic-like serine/threonine-protein kinase
MEEGSTIGPYRIFEAIGQGGMGIVYRARHTGTGRAVALKTVHVEAPKWLDSIRREIRSLTRIRHPGIVRIVDDGVQQGLPWYAMDLLEGETLRHFGRRIWSPYRRPSVPPPCATDELSETEGLQPDPVPWSVGPMGDPSTRDRRIPAAAGELRHVLAIVRRLCATIAYLHGEGFVNCDLKPENILIVGERPIVIDFGLTAHHPGRTGREAIEPPRSMGTLLYMSPEQLRGEFVDARSDIYSLGCILYELLVGNPPFHGSPRSIRSHHLSSAALPPSEVAEGISPELEGVVLKLLEKELDARFGYADEVAAILGRLNGDSEPLDLPPPSPYFYRSRFVGREDILTRLGEVREEAAGGSGALVMLAGESGVGKTRLAMEVTRQARNAGMRIVASEASSLSSESAAAVGPTPLHALRPLLSAIADRCQEGGPDMTEQLLGHQGSILAMYEPLLGHVPAHGAFLPPAALGVEASRKRLFKCIAETMASLAREHPLLWVIDDLGWADELSLAFLHSLTREYIAANPLFILCTYRSEEANDEVAALAARPHVMHLVLRRLGRDAVSSLIGDMLALPRPSEGLVQFVTSQAEGNPFFVAEYLRTAVAERVLYRDQTHSWRLLGDDRETRADSEYQSLPLPRSLREHIEQRFRRLSPAGQQAALAAAVVGRDADVDILRAVVGMSDEAVASAVDELLRRQFLEQPNIDQVRFAHDKLREVTYALSSPERLVHLHARTAQALEARGDVGSDPGRGWAILGHHFAAARLSESAARYLRLAADHARETYANGEAVRLYREAINQTHHLLLSLSSESEACHTSLAELYESVGDVHRLAGQNEEARTAYLEALRRTVEMRKSLRARLNRKLGKTWEAEHRHDEALRFYDLAEHLLGADPVETEPEHRDEWFQIRTSQLWVYYWLNKVPQMDAIVTRLRPIIETDASPLQRVTFFRCQFLLGLRRDRYAVSDEGLQFTRAALRACGDDRAVAERPMAHFNHGFALLFSGSARLAALEFESADTLARRSGDAPLQVRCATYRTLAARMDRRTEDARHLVEESERLALESNMLEYIAAAHANRSWLALRRGDNDACRQLARKALDIWSHRLFPFHWMALLPLLEAALAQDDVDEAIECAGAMLGGHQQVLAARVSEALDQARRCWLSERRTAARAALQTALHEFEQAGYR